ncbi:hypothetical protein GGX14DRAFT_699345 [Mycena pura]|uniref:F-box domain-containing protein n=1 Tax=Mycena pura TaxID=153505 RepID=A0AAD6V778_9AGAR|nr:hypothetical protein GGX14DRAFT_699345 [Mycena pura]
MSATRRQSGRLAAQATSLSTGAKTDASETKSPNKKKAGTSKPQEEEDDFEDSEESGSEAESDASEYGSKGRPAKRQKTTKSTSRILKKSKLSRASTECLLTAMPLDILSEVSIELSDFFTALSFCEIFGYLEPKDLIWLSRTNRDFRGHLLSNASSGVWKKAGENVDSPDCPEDMAQHQWAHLLHGKAQCGNCGARNIQRVDFGIRRRACTTCLKNNLVVTSRFKKLYPHLEESILDLIPYTNVGGHSHGHASSSCWYWNADIENMEKKLVAFDHDIHMRVPNARKKLEDFIAQQTAQATSIVEHAAICRNWSKVSLKRREQEKHRQREQRYNDVKARFNGLGYTDVDIERARIRGHRRVDQTAQLNDRTWNTIRQELESIIMEEKERRLKAEHETRMIARKKVAAAVYTDYMKTLVPDQWRFLPGLYDILQNPAFSTVINAPDDVDVGPAHFQEAAATLPDLAAAWASAHKVRLLQLIQDAQTSSQVPVTETTTTSLPPHSLDSATAIFACEQSRCRSGPGAQYALMDSTFIGDSAVTHRCKVRSSFNRLCSIMEFDISVETKLGLSKPGALAAASLIKLAGLDGADITCAQMDQVDLRVICVVCQPRVVKGKECLRVYPWREAVSHFVRVGHATPVWRLLNDVESQQARMNESESSDPTLSWSCNHCPHHLDNWQTFNSVVNHVKTTHGIAKPTAPNDLFRYLKMIRNPTEIYVPRVLQPKPTKTNPPPGPMYNCLRCATASQSQARREFILSGVKSHLKDKHKIENPAANQDYRQKGGP